MNDLGHLSYPRALLQLVYVRRRQFLPRVNATLTNTLSILSIATPNWAFFVKHIVIKLLYVYQIQVFFKKLNYIDVFILQSISDAIFCSRIIPNKHYKYMYLNI